MRKVLLSFSLLLLIGGLKAQQDFRLTQTENIIKPRSISKEASGNAIELGYCGESTIEVGVGAKVDFKTAIQFPKVTMKKYVGNQLTKILVAAGSDTGATDAQVYLSYTLGGEAFYTQDVTFTPNQWNEIVLTTPYQVEEKEIFVGYRIVSGSNQKKSPLVTDQGPSNELGNYLAMKNKSGQYDWGHMVDYTLPLNVAIKAVIEGSSLPQYDISLDYLMPSKSFATQGESIIINGTLKNIGAQTINSFDIVYQIGNNAPITLPVQGKNVANAAKCDFKIENIAINSEGITPIKVSISNLNGNADVDESNNTTTTSIACPGANSAPVSRKVLLENFTTAQCGNCPGAHTILDKALGENENVIWVAHHAGYGVDNYTITPSIEYTWFYNSNGQTYAPAIMFDRTNLDEYGAGGEGNTPVFNVAKTIVEKTLKARLEDPAYVTIEIAKTLTSNELNITISGKAVLGNLPGMAQMNVYLTENGLIGTQSGGGSKYVHNNVIRAVLSKVWGDPVTFDADGNYSVTYKFNVANGLNTEKMKIVAFLSNYDSKNVNNCNVYNAQILDVNPSDINSVDATEAIRVYSNNSLITIDGEYTSATVFDTTGKIIDILGNQQNEIKVANGIYIVRITNNEQTIIKKVIVK